jgi:exopolysaccharide production protein ExoQ
MGNEPGTLTESSVPELPLMPRLAAAVAYSLVICALFWLNRDYRGRTSTALWLPIAYLLINGSRPLSSWLQTQTVSSPEQLLEGSPFDRTIYLGLIAASVIVLARRQTIVIKFVRANAAMLLFALYCFLSISWSDYPGVAFKRWIRLLGDFTMVMIVLTDPGRPRAIKRVLATVGFVLIPVSILLIKYYPEIARSYDPYSGRQFVSGVATDKNMLGMTCLVYGLGALWQFLILYREKKSRVRTRRLIAHGALLAMALWLFSSADSMTSFSCFIMVSGLIVMTSLFRMARKRLMVNLMVAVILVVPLGVLFLHVGEGAALESIGRNSTLTGRTEIWAVVLKFQGNPLLGTGFDSFWLGKRLEKIWATGSMLRGINEAHNGYLETYLNLGWIGVSLLAGLIVAGYRDVMTALRLDSDVGRLRLAFLVVAVVYNFTEAGFRTSGTVWAAFLLAIAVMPGYPVLRRSRPLAGSESEVESAVASHQREQQLVAG